MVNDQTGKSLDALRVQIFQAEAVLQRIPGARHDDCYVEIEEDSDWFLYYGEVNDELCIYKANGCRFHRTPLIELPLAERVELAGLIPELIDDAESAESSIAKDAEKVATALEQYFATRAESSD